MKKLLFIFCSVLAILVVCGVVLVGMGRRLIDNNLNNFDRWILEQADLEKFIDGKTYMVLLQNSYELRATGGFMGSYVRVKTAKTGIGAIEVQDIYVPDGQLAGHVEPSYPVQEAFRQGWWKLRDSNWDPDFASAAATIAWFFDQGGEKKVDGIVAVNLSLVNSILKVLGEVRTVSYTEKVTAKNLYSLAQKYAEVNHDKGDFLGAVGEAMLWKIKQINLIDLIKLINLMHEELDKKQILIWIKGIDVGKWGGKLDSPPVGGDYLYIVESNLGANKANCCVERKVKQEIENNAEKLTITWENKSEFEDPKPPVFWGGNYIDYVRVIMPKDAEVQGVKVADKDLRLASEEDFRIPNSTRQERSEDMYVVEKRGDLQIVGFWAVVPAGQKVRAELSYTSPLVPLLNSGEGKLYRVLVKRQPGIEGFAYQLTVNGKVMTDRFVDRDIWIK